MQGQSLSVEDVATEGLLPQKPALRPNHFGLLRMLAATQVMFFHTTFHFRAALPSWVQPLSALMGVPIFFTISGFLVSASLENLRFDLRAYFWHRALRIFPALWTCIFITLTVVLALGYRMQTAADALWLPLQLVGALYTPNFLRTFGMGSYNGSFWTIPVELQFYILLPAMYLLTKRFRGGSGAFLALFALAFCSAVILGQVFPTTVGIVGVGQTTLPQRLLGYTVIPTLYQFLLGVLLQRSKAQQQPWIRNRGHLWLCGFGIWAWLVPISPLSICIRMCLLGTAAISLAYSLPGAMTHLFQRADISYGLYLFHGFWINVLLTCTKLQAKAACAAVFLLTTLTAIVSWYVVERPCLRWKDWPSRL